MMAGINGEAEWAKLTGLLSDQISRDFADTADGVYKPIVAWQQQVGWWSTAEHPIWVSPAHCYRLLDAKREQLYSQCSSAQITER